MGHEDEGSPTHEAGCQTPASRKVEERVFFSVCLAAVFVVPC